MGKKKTLLARLKEPKNKPTKDSFKPSVKSQRKKYYFKQGEGSVGVCIRRPRLLRFMRNIRKHSKVTGLTTKSTKQVFYKGYTDVVIGAVDAYTNRLLETAAGYAKQRKSGTGLKLRKSDLEEARKLIIKISHNN